MILIFANGDLPSPNWVKPYLAQAAVVMAADGGLHHLQALNYRPDILIGDLDSVTDIDLTEIKAAGVRIVSHPRAKDETDLELALIYAAREYAGPIMVVGAIGGRLDQTMANVLLLAHPALIGREVKFLEEYQRAWLVRDQTTISGQKGDLVSLLPLSGEVEIAQTAGLQWPLHREKLILGPARGISNVMTASKATITVSKGLILCVHTVGGWDR